MYRPFLALRYLLTRPINLLGVFGVTLGVWALIVVVSIFSGFLDVVGEHVRSASADISVLYLPQSAGLSELLAQLAEGGRLIVPVGEAGRQELVLIERIAGRFERRVLEAVSFVPLLKGTV